MVGMPDASHPVWPIARMAVMLAALTAILWLTASKFDETEVRTIIYTFIAAASVESVPAAAKRFFGKREDQ